MGGIVAKQAFLPPPSSYDDSLEHLTWVSKPRCSDKVPVLWLQRSKSARFTIIFSHGNAEDIGQLSHWLQHICKKMEVNVITYDYIGYGLHKADSLPSEASCFADVLAVYRFATEQEGVPPSRIILYGRSLGSGPTCWLASHLWNEWRKSLKAKSCKRSGGFLSSILSPSASTEPSVHFSFPIHSFFFCLSLSFFSPLWCKTATGGGATSSSHSAEPNRLMHSSRIGRIGQAAWPRHVCQH
ncbi:AB hydrolase-1 domain-containing protein, variant 2 [Balamuthia mandrillaris]